ncbi:MAG: hypothetical protein QM442_00920 [Spirochaetota bacterium]|nr:hypothetical protein [Spirochaetota bacterium]
MIIGASGWCWNGIILYLMVPGGNPMTDFLFATPSFLEGVGRNIDLFGSLNRYNTSISGKEADLKARANDVAVLRRDMEIASAEVLDGYGSQEKP